MMTISFENYYRKYILFQICLSFIMHTSYLSENNDWLGETENSNQ